MVQTVPVVGRGWVGEALCVREGVCLKEGRWRWRRKYGCIREVKMAVGVPGRVRRPDGQRPQKQHIELMMGGSS